MTELSDLYQEIILDHGKNPRNFEEMTDYTHTHEGYNPLCGDQLTLYLLVKEGWIEKASFTGSGCAISMASTSLMTEQLIGRKLSEVDEWINDFLKMVTKDECGQHAGTKLEVLAGVKSYPMRVKCATLPWHTLKAVSNNSGKKVSTE